MSLEALLELMGDEDFLAIGERKNPKSYEIFVNRVNKDLDLIIGATEADAKDFQFVTEDFLNREIVRMLRMKCYIAVHDKDEGGHVDIHISCQNEKYTWAGEAKIYDGPDYIYKGLVQLTTRYARGTPGHNSGGILVYIQKSRCGEFFAKWRKELEERKDEWEDILFEDCPTRSELAFYTEFVLPRIGKGPPKYRIRHIGVSAFREANVDPA